MVVEIDMRIDAKNMTVQQFDGLINELKKTVARTEQVDSNTQGFGNLLLAMQTQLQYFAESSRSFTDTLGVVGQNFVQTTEKMEEYSNGVIALEESTAATDDRLTSLKETIQLPNAPHDGAIEVVGQFRTVGSEVQLANRSVKEFTNGLQTEAQVAVKSATLGQLSNQALEETEYAGNNKEIAAQLRQLEIDYELEKTLITLEEVEKRTEINERAAQSRIDFAKLEADVRLKTHQEAIREISSAFKEIDDTNLQDRTDALFGGLFTQDVAPREALQQTQDFIMQTDELENSLQNLETSLYVFGSIFKHEFTNRVQSGASLLSDFKDSLHAPGLDALAEDVRRTDVISGLEVVQSARDLQTAERFAVGAETFREHDRYDTQKASSLVSSVGREQTFSTEMLTEGAGNLVSAVPLDVVEAVTNSVQLRRDATAELVQLEQEAAAEIRIIQESLTLSAENKAKAIERVERETALERIRIENEVSQRQRASFQSVVTNFVSGIGQMIAAEAQLALARSATDTLGGLFGGSSAAATSGAGLLSSVFLPVLGGLSLAYGAAKLIGHSSPSVDVYQRAQYGVSGEGANRNVQQTQSLTSTSPESDTHTLEANVNVTVEASGTRLGQANSRVQLKTERWGG